MEYGLEIHREATLQAALAEWKHTEDLFSHHFDKDALNTRDFMKMKLKEFDRMWYAFNGRPLTKDERALMRMVRFQRRITRRMLYPGLPGRLWNRTANFLAFVSEPKERSGPRRDDTSRYAGYTIRVDGDGQSSRQNRQEAKQRYQRRYSHSPDLGKLNPQDNGLKKGPSI